MFSCASSALSSFNTAAIATLALLHDTSSCLALSSLQSHTVKPGSPWQVAATQLRGNNMRRQSAKAVVTSITAVDCVGVGLTEAAERAPLFGGGAAHSNVRRKDGQR